MQMLATPSRVQILGQLKHGACSVGTLTAAIGMEASAVSHQLRSLRQLGLVVGERRGKQIIHGLHDSHVAELLDQAISTSNISPSASPSRSMSRRSPHEH